MLKGRIKQVELTTGSCAILLSPICSKRVHSHRLILNLEKRNVYISYHHFKMDTLQCALQLVSPKCWMTVLDLIRCLLHSAISNSQGKADKVKLAIQSLLKQNSPVIREVASVVGLMVSSFPGVRYGPLFYRALENEKN